MSGDSFGIATLFCVDKSFGKFCFASMNPLDKSVWLNSVYIQEKPSEKYPNTIDSFDFSLKYSPKVHIENNSSEKYFFRRNSVFFRCVFVYMYFWPSKTIKNYKKCWILEEMGLFYKNYFVYGIWGPDQRPRRTRNGQGTREEQGKNKG